MAFQPDPSKALDAPIPGQSLTAPPKSSPWEVPPQFTDPMEASNYIFDKLSRNSGDIGMMLKSGASAEEISRTTLMGGFQKGLWTPDMAMMLAPLVMLQVAELGQMMGVKNLKIFRNRQARDQFRSQMISLIPDDEAIIAQAPTEEEVAATEPTPKDAIKLTGLLA